MQYSKLVEVAREVRAKAYAPYSEFAVGAALQTKSGDVYAGCNVENLSFGLTLCAERSAIASAIANGVRDFVAIAIVADSKQPPLPCGACRQVMAEFNPNLTVVSATVSGEVQEFLLADLLPHPDQGVLEGRRHV
ncbi:MAG TPA: cytidine deaminase [Chthoniobacterales bacterium]|nr:cytidine deaminase [Chthoniobacterales bacterium]